MNLKITNESTRTTSCQHDTDGDGNCGMPTCQWCRGEITTPNQSEFIMRILKATAFKYCEDIFWRTDNEYAPITFIIHCSDVFNWGCSDSERVTPENIHILEQSLQEADNYGAALFCARVRKKRPMDRFFENIPSFNIRARFHACGPERETNMTNPKV